uniref:Fibronectin type-III domain-containing protein n=1 Tax=Clytia hemisphaerica TaxID=252671 RepID=A0A7M5X9S1_9CNID
MTTAGRPEVPPNEISSLPSNDSLIYTWGVPYLELIYGAALTYNISHCGILRNGSQTCWFKQNQSIPTICEKVRDPHSIFTNCALRVDGLLPSTFYTVNISHCGIEGCTNWTSFQSSTSEMAPSGQVPGVTVFGLTESINASWSLMEIMKRRGVIISYNISARFITPLWWPVNESAVPQTLYFNSSTLSCLLYGLQNDSLYNVSVTALTSVGSGPWSEPVQIRTLQNVPTAAPINVSADGIRTEISVDWLPIDRFYHQGILLGYNISFQAREPFPDRGGRLQGYDLSFLPNISHVVYGLNPFTTYDIRVSGFTEIGSGLRSEAINATTDPFIDGNWTEWTQWGNCEVSCGLGVSSRQRWCINPPPENGGARCVNGSKESRKCNDFPCDGFYLGKPGESCDKTCIDLSSEFLCNPLMELDNSTSQFLEALDAYNYREKNANVSCISNSGTDKYTLLEDPQFNPLNEVCIGFRNLPNITDCSALPSENNNRRLCQCLDEKNVGYGEWTSWSLCEVSCGGGRARRSRACSIPFGGCSGPSMQVGDCNTDPCPIYGNWGQWGEYSECTKTCGFGVERRIRKCDSPKPQFGGEECPGTDVDEIEGCNPMPCPVHGQWGSWGEFEECLKPCGNQSLRISRRYCDSPKPLFDGLDCVGNNTKSEKCDFGNITCAEIPLNLVLRFVDEEWHFMMYRPQDPRIVDLRRRIMENVMAFYRDNNIDTAFDLNNLRIDFHGQWKGSVVMNFTIIYPENPFVEVFMMQSELESGSLKNLSLVPQNITSKKLPLAPANISLSSPQPFIINLSWKENPSNNYTEPKNDPFYLYYVFYAQIHDEANYKINKWINFGSKNTSVQLRDLESGSLYAVRILASTIKTMGLSTETQVIQVYEGRKYCTYSAMQSWSKYFEILVYFNVFQ